MAATEDQPPALFGIHSVFWAALAADFTLLVTDSILTAIFTSHSAWHSTWVLASVFMGKVVLHWPAVFDFGAFTAAVTGLYPFCFCYTLILALVVLPWNLCRAASVGAVFGVLCYLPSIYGLALWRPWVTGERGWILVVGHAVFGLTATGVLLYRSRGDFD